MLKRSKIDLPFIIDNLKRAFRIFCHSYATASENTVRSCIQNININFMNYCHESIDFISIVVEIIDVSSFLRINL